MADTSQFTIGTEASCSDGPAGKVTRLIVDPLAEKVTHLVIGPEHRRDTDRLVPLDLIDATAGQVRIRCTQAEFDKLDPAQETQFIPSTSGYEGFGYGAGEVGYWPYYRVGGGLGAGGLGLGGGMEVGGMEVGGMEVGGGTSARIATRDIVPLGEVDVQRGDYVHATDGDIGRVQGLVIDPGSRHVTHVLLQEGHLWGRKDVAIPIGVVASTSGGIQLTITKQQVQDLPPVDIDHPDLT
jgi:hypothetical protein